MTSAALRSQARSPFEPFQRDLPRAPELLPVNSSRTQDNYEIAIREGMAEILPGFQTPIYGYEGIYPGPTIRARKGREIVVRQRNTLPFESNVHLHGGYVPAESDGHPMDVIAAGGSFDYTYPNQQDAATLWYHDHAHGRTSKTLYYGLNAMYVLEDDLETELGLPQGEYDVPIVIADHAFNRDGSFRYAENVDVGFRGYIILAERAILLRTTPAAQATGPALLDASNAASAHAGRPAVGDDADRRRRRPAQRPVSRTRIRFHPAERIDLVLDFSGTRPGSSSCCPTATASAARCRSCASTSRAAAARGLPVPSWLRASDRLRPRRGRRGTSARHRRWQINGKASTRTASTSALGAQHGDLDVRQPLATACTRCTSTASCSGCSSAPAGPVDSPSGSAGRTRSARTPDETVTVLARFAPDAAATCSTATRSSTPTGR